MPNSEACVLNPDIKYYRPIREIVAPCGLNAEAASTVLLSLGVVGISETPTE